MIKLKVNNITSKNIKTTELKDGVLWGTIFNIPTYTIFKKLYEKEYVQKVYNRRLGWEK